MSGFLTFKENEIDDLIKAIENEKINTPETSFMYDGALTKDLSQYTIQGCFCWYGMNKTFKDCSGLPKKVNIKLKIMNVQLDSCKGFSQEVGSVEFDDCVIKSWEGLEYTIISKNNFNKFILPLDLETIRYHPTSKDFLKFIYLSENKKFKEYVKNHYANYYKDDKKEVDILKEILNESLGINLLQIL